MTTSWHSPMTDFSLSLTEFPLVVRQGHTLIQTIPRLALPVPSLNKGLLSLYPLSPTISALLTAWYSASASPAALQSATPQLTLAVFFLPLLMRHARSGPSALVQIACNLIQKLCVAFLRGFRRLQNLARRHTEFG